MSFRTQIKSLSLLSALLILLAASPSDGAVYNLKTGVFNAVMPDGATVTMWGFGLSTGIVNVPGPMLTVPPGDSTLTINLTNNLPYPVSIVIPGQRAVLSPVSFTDGQGRQRVRSFTAETAGGGGTRTYSWSGLKPGTYIYHSGTQPQVQVQMGLYGGLKKNSATSTAYAGYPYDNEAVLLYSEIDPALHAAIVGGTYGTLAYPSTMNYAPKYFLINGKPYPQSQPTIAHAINAGERVLVRLLNAGLNTHVPALEGMYMKVIAEDGNLYPYPKEQYSVLLPAGKTADAMLAPDAGGTYAVYDRMLSLTNADVSPGGMLAYLTVAGPVGAPGTPGSAEPKPLPGNASPAAVDDSAATARNRAVLINLTANDYDPDGTIDASSVSVKTQPKRGTVTNKANGSVTYSPKKGFRGTDEFTYTVKDNAGAVSNAATVRVTVK